METSEQKQITMSKTPPPWVDTFKKDLDEKNEKRDAAFKAHVDSLVKPLAQKLETLAAVVESLKDQLGRVPGLEKHLAALQQEVDDIKQLSGTSYEMLDEVMSLRKDKEQRDRENTALIEYSGSSSFATKEEVATTMQVPMAEIKSVSLLPDRGDRRGVKRVVVVCDSISAAERLKDSKHVDTKVMRNRGTVELREAAISRELNVKAPSDLRFQFRKGVYMVVKGSMWAPYPIWKHAVNPLSKGQLQLQHCTEAEIKELAGSALQHGTKVPELVLSRMRPRTIPTTSTTSTAAAGGANKRHQPDDPRTNTETATPVRGKHTNTGVNA